jgi:hypothetical protein
MMLLAISKSAEAGPKKLEEEHPQEQKIYQTYSKVALRDNGNSNVVFSLYNSKFILDPSVKFRQLKAIDLSGGDFVQLEYLARCWDNPDKKELCLSNFKNHSLRPLDKMTNIYLKIDYIGDPITINQMDYLSRLIKAPTDSKALCQSAVIRVNRVCNKARWGLRVCPSLRTFASMREQCFVNGGAIVLSSMGKMLLK